MKYNDNQDHNGDRQRPIAGTLGWVIMTAALATAMFGCTEPVEQASAPPPESGAVDTAIKQPADSAPIFAATNPITASPNEQLAAVARDAIEHDESGGPRPEYFEAQDQDGGGADVTASSKVDAAQQSPESGFSLAGDASGVYWQPAHATTDAAGVPANYAHLTLTVSGPGGELIQHRFAPGEAIAVGAANGQLPDGIYKWETTAAPVIEPQVRAQMSAVREAGDLTAERALIKRLRDQGQLPTEAEARANVKFGQFRIQDGQIVLADAVETGDRD